MQVTRVVAAREELPVRRVPDQSQRHRRTDHAVDDKFHRVPFTGRGTKLSGGSVQTQPTVVRHNQHPGETAEQRVVQNDGQNSTGARPQTQPRTEIVTYERDH